MLILPHKPKHYNSASVHIRRVIKPSVNGIHANQTCLPRPYRKKILLPF
jgi:hypothetical protein